MLDTNMLNKGLERAQKYMYVFKPASMCRLLGRKNNLLNSPKFLIMVVSGYTCTYHFHGVSLSSEALKTNFLHLLMTAIGSIHGLECYERAGKLPFTYSMLKAWL